ncbi:hypothetical protein BDQ17DRAFT_704959 [Cyathus striatus]|nr:hypothetical protein BDQ17DRAFT_704959 [Cyathus striatus]
MEHPQHFHKPAGNGTVVGRSDGKFELCIRSSVRNSLAFCGLGVYLQHVLLPNNLSTQPLSHFPVFLTGDFHCQHRQPPLLSLSPFTYILITPSLPFTHPLHPYPCPFVMASLLERMNLPSSSAGPIRSKTSGRGTAPAPYNRADRIPKGDVDSQWSHDLFERHNSLQARINSRPSPPKAGLNPIAQKAIRDATATLRGDKGISIKGASTISEGNVVDVTGLVAGTTPEDVAAIFKRCGTITSSKLINGGENVKIRVTFKLPTSAASAVQKFDQQPADGKILSVKIVGASTAGTTLVGRLGEDGLGVVRDEGSVDILMDVESQSGSKMRSDALIKEDPRAHVLTAPPGADPKDYAQTHWRGGRRGGRGGRGRGGGWRRGGRSNGMDLD